MLQPMKFKNAFLFLLVVALLPSCRVSSTYYSRSYQDWQTKAPDSTAKLKYEVFLLGDAGETAINNDPVLTLLQSKLEKASANSAIVFLGDNIYHSGLPDVNDAGRKEAERRINAQLDMLKNFKGRPFFVPGNHDWGYNLKETHLLRVQREMEYVQKYLGKKDVFYPENGCPGPAVINLTNDLTMLAIDPNWLIGDGYRVGTKCDITDDASFAKQLKESVSMTIGKNLIIAAHQPLWSTGPHNGYVGWKPHLVPLFGSIYAAVRYWGGSRQDLHNKHYKKYVNTVLDAVKDKPNVVFAAGHEHTLEYFAHSDNLHEVLSGAGCKKSGIRKNANLSFGAHFNGFSIIKYYDNDEAWVEYWTPNSCNKGGQLLFRTKMYVRK